MLSAVKYLSTIQIDRYKFEVFIEDTGMFVSVLPDSLTKYYPRDVVKALTLASLRYKLAHTIDISERLPVIKVTVRDNDLLARVDYAGYAGEFMLNDEIDEQDCITIDYSTEVENALATISSALRERNRNKEAK